MYARASSAEKTPQIAHCQVDRPHQGKGRGGLLIKAARASAKHKGSSREKVKMKMLDTHDPVVYVPTMHMH